MKGGEEKTMNTDKYAHTHTTNCLIFLLQTRLHIGQLTKNVTKDHLQEIFSVYGSVKEVDVPAVS